MNGGAGRDEEGPADGPGKDESHRHPASPSANPYKPPQTDPIQRNPSTHPSVFFEPWMQDKGYVGIEDAVPAAHHVPLAPNPENSVWDEPGRAHELSGPIPADAVTWFRWYQDREHQTPAWMSWGVALTVALFSGLAAVVGAMFVQPPWQQPLVVAVIAAPITEEILKIAVAMWICEKRPWLLRSPVQILLCGLTSGFVFACVENLLYLNVYILNPQPGIVAWRWTVCMFLHMTCSTIASIGVVRVWTEFRSNHRMPRLADGSRWFVAAMVLHGAYNMTATLLESAGYRF
jgi:hypothetical protein